MWQPVAAFFVSPVAKIGGIVLKVWMVGGIILTGTIGTAFYLFYSTNTHQALPVSQNISNKNSASFISPSASNKNQEVSIHQNVIVLVGGMNTSINSVTCAVDGFGPLVQELKSTLHIMNPYDTGCSSTQQMNNRPISLTYFSYLGGKLNPNTGIWKPIPYKQCVPDITTLVNDDNTFIETLSAYRAHYPHAHFTIIGHSLGGLVALTGAANFVNHFGPNIIDKVITIDSPLHGVPTSGQLPNSRDECKFFTGPILLSLNALYRSPNVTQLDVAHLEAKGTAVYTLGNNADCLYQNALCAPGLVKGFGGTGMLNDTQTQYEANAFKQSYDIVEPLSSRVSLGVPGHGAILSNSASLKDIVRFVLAPDVTITQPQPDHVFRSNTTGTSISFSVTVHCDWGTINKAVALLAVPGSKPYIADMSIKTNDPYAADVNGVVNLPPHTSASHATFYIDASGNACQLPANTPSFALPKVSDYLGGDTTGVPVSFDGGKSVA